MTSDFEEEAQRDSSRRASTCSVRRLLEGLDDKMRGDVERTMARREITGPAIVRALQRRGIDTVSVWSLGNHRRGHCSCEKKETA